MAPATLQSREVHFDYCSQCLAHEMPLERALSL